MKTQRSDHSGFRAAATVAFVLVTACLVLGAEVEGREIGTVEGLAQDGELTPLQRSFVHEGGIQCGYCTPGMILEAHAFLHRLEGRRPSTEEIQHALRRHICRCGSYQRILAAVHDAARLSAEAR